MDITFAERFKIFNTIDDLRPFQQELYDKLIEEKRVCISTYSGNGKTTMIKYIAFSFLDQSRSNRCAIFVNTRILALDIERSMEDILLPEDRGLLCNMCKFDAQNYATNSELEAARIFISTPGKFKRFINKVGTRFDFLCIDEVDSLLETKGDVLESDILDILQQLRFEYSLVVTATLNQDVYTHILSKYNFISKEFNHVTPCIDVMRIALNKRDRDWHIMVCDKIYYIVQEHRMHKRVIVFCNYKEDCDKLFNEYSAPVNTKFCIHGNYSTAEIDSMFRQYQQTGKILFTTDMAQRGLDVRDIDIIFHVGLTNPKTFYHRNGRTLRKIGASPLCFIFYDNENHELVKNVPEKQF